MNVETGELKHWEEVEKLSEEEQKKYVEVKRDLTVLENHLKQVELYSPCGCGSGKKFKFCCHNKPKSKEEKAEQVNELIDKLRKDMEDHARNQTGSLS